MSIINRHNKRSSIFNIRDYSAYVLQHKLFKNTSLYTASEILNKAIPFLLLPIMTRYLSASDYGIVATFSAYVSILCVFVGLSAHGAVNVNFFKMEKDELTSYIFNVFLILITSTVIVVLVIFTFKSEIAEKLSLPSKWIFIGVFVALAKFITLINLILWQAEQRAKPFCIYQISQMFFDLIISIGLVVGLALGWLGRLTGLTLATFIFAILSLIVIINRGYIKICINILHIRDALVFGVPLIPHVLSIWFMTSIDRFFINHFVGLGDTGIYSVGYQIGMIIGIIATAFNKAWAPFFYGKMNEVDDPGKLQLVKFTYIYFIVIILLALLLALPARLFIHLMLGSDFIESARFVFWIALSYSFNGMYFMVCLYIMYTKKTHILSIASFIVGVLHVFISFYFIKRYGAIGAAQAMMISFFIRFILVWILSARVFPMPWVLALRRV
jgi:O-antigen/teichoic acid export membrane protein